MRKDGQKEMAITGCARTGNGERYYRVRKDGQWRTRLQGAQGRTIESAITGCARTDNGDGNYRVRKDGQ